MLSKNAKKKDIIVHKKKCYQSMQKDIIHKKCYQSMQKKSYNS